MSKESESRKSKEGHDKKFESTNSILEVNGPMKVPRKTYLCPFCSFVHSNKNELSSHASEAHKGKTIYFCSVCDVCFGRKGSLIRHMSHYHANKKCKDCQTFGICAKHLKNYNTLTENKPFEAVPDEVSDEIYEVEDAEKRDTKSAINCQNMPIKVKLPSSFKKTKLALHSYSAETSEMQLVSKKIVPVNDIPVEGTSKLR